MTETNALPIVRDNATDFILDINALPAAAVVETVDTSNDRPIRIDSRKVPIPPHRFSPLKSAWPSIPSTSAVPKASSTDERQNKAVELRTSRYTMDLGALQKGEDFVKAFALGFDVADAVALL
jgi:RNA-binding protein PNO1